MASPADAPAVDLAAAMVTAPMTLADWLVVLPVAIPMATGALLVMVRHGVRHHPLIAALGLIALLAVDLALLGRVLREGPVVMMMGSWLPPFGIAFQADLLGTTLATVSALVGLCVAVFAGPTINTHERRYGFYPFLMLLLAGVTGAFLTGDIFNLYVWFEVLLISSFGLLILGSEKAQIDGTVKYGILNLMATTLFLIATGLLYGTLGTLNMAEIAVKARAEDVAGPMVTIAALYFVAFAMKSAAFPLHVWLPASYHTPAAGASAVFAALLTKVGVYALLKTMVLLLGPQAAALGALPAWIAGLTMIVGALGALAQSDLRRLLGFLVVSGIGNMLVGVALATGDAITGAVFYAVHSMIVMAALYLAAGVVEEVAGTGELRRLGGMAHASPVFAAVFLVLSLAVAGLPPFSGFWPKAMLVDAALAAGAPWLAAAVLVSGFLITLAVARAFLFAAWRGGPEGTPDGAVDVSGLTDLPAEDRPARLMPLGLLTAIVVIIGLFPAPLFHLAGGASAGLVDPAGYVGALFGGAP